jgi:hypothetical protein
MRVVVVVDDDDNDIGDVNNETTMMGRKIRESTVSYCSY